MPQKTYTKTGRACRVTFRLPGGIAAQTVALCGEFNDWDPTTHPMIRRKDGSFSLTLSLPAGRSYRYRYLLDSTQWTNDSTADASVPNPFGAEDSLINI